MCTCLGEKNIHFDIDIYTSEKLSYIPAYCVNKFGIQVMHHLIMSNGDYMKKYSRLRRYRNLLLKNVQ